MTVTLTVMVIGMASEREHWQGILSIQADSLGLGYTLRQRFS